MTRRDLIIVAVLANIGVLAILFMLAFRTEDEKGIDHSTVAYTETEETVNPLQPPVEVSVVKPEKPEPMDMIDAALEEEGLHQTHSIVTADDDTFQIVEPDVQQDVAALAETPSPKTEKSPSPKESQEPQFVEVTVKRGDALEKIARANGTTVEAIMKANNLKNDRLSIGQSLKVPVGTRKKPSPSNNSVKDEAKKSKAESPNSPEYYTLMSGDNPWKIAKQFHLKLDELLKLNNLNEEKARNLKVGDTIRVK